MNPTRTGNAMRDELTSLDIHMMNNQEVCEAIRSHFESHPTMPGEKWLKDRANELLGNPDTLDTLDEAERQKLDYQYALTRIRETKLAPRSGPGVVDAKGGDVNIAHDRNSFDLKTSGADLYDLKYNKLNGPLTSTIGVQLQKTEAGVDVYAPDKTGKAVMVGALSESFLKNNPMNVDACKATMVVEDFSGGQLKTVSQYLVVDTDIMSGDIVDLSASMLPKMENSQMIGE